MRLAVSRNMPFQIKFYSRMVHPDSIRMSDLADVLKAVEAGILAIAKNQADSISSDNLGLCLVNIKEGCAALEFQSLHPETTDSALKLFTRSIKNKEIDALPLKAQQSISAIEDFSEKYQCNTHLRNKANLKKPSAIIKRPRVIKLVDDIPLKGETTIYGTVERVGGAGKPRIWLRLLDGERVGFDVDEEVAINFGKRIYKKIGLQGVAQWAANGKDIVAFQLKNFIDYSDIPIDKAFKELSDELSEYIRIESVLEFISDIRGD